MPVRVLQTYFLFSEGIEVHLAHCAEISPDWDSFIAAAVNRRYTCLLYTSHGFDHGPQLCQTLRRAAERTDPCLLYTSEIPESVTCFMPEDRIFVKLTSDQLLQPYPVADGADAVARIQAISPVENPEITCRWGCYAGHQALDITDPDNKQAPILAIEMCIRDSVFSVWNVFN